MCRNRASCTRSQTFSEFATERTTENSSHKTKVRQAVEVPICVPKTGFIKNSKKVNDKEDGDVKSRQTKQTRRLCRCHSHPSFPLPFSLYCTLTGNSLQRTEIKLDTNPARHDTCYTISTCSSLQKSECSQDSLTPAWDGRGS